MRRFFKDDGVSILTVSLFVVWNYHLLTSSYRDVVFMSHDEVGWFSSRDVSVAGSVRQQFKRGARRVIVDGTDVHNAAEDSPPGRDAAGLTDRNAASSTPTARVPRARSPR